jgi:hypothetical protein
MIVSICYFKVTPGTRDCVGLPHKPGVGSEYRSA